MKRRLIIVQRAQVDAKGQWIPQGWSVACCFWVKSGWVNLKMLPFKRKQWLQDWFITFFSLSLSPPFFIQEEQSRLHSKKWQKNKLGSENEQVAHQVTVAADAFIEVLQPRVGEHKASLCKWVCRVRANEIYQSRGCNCGRQGFYSACEETENVSGEAFLPANDLYFA